MIYVQTADIAVTSLQAIAGTTVVAMTGRDTGFVQVDTKQMSTSHMCNEATYIIIVCWSINGIGHQEWVVIVVGNATKETYSKVDKSSALQGSCCSKP